MISVVIIVFVAVVIVVVNAKIVASKTFGTGL